MKLGEMAGCDRFSEAYSMSITTMQGPHFRRDRRMLGVVSALYLTVWFLPSAEISMGFHREVLHGWDATLFAMQPNDWHRVWQLLGFTSALSNLRFVAAAVLA